MHNNPINPTKLLYLVADARYFYTHRLPLAIAAKANGFDVHVACPDTALGNGQDESIQAIRAAGLTFHHVPFNRRSLNPFDAIVTIYRIACLYSRVKPTIVHHVAIKPVLFGTIAAHLSHVPHIINAVAGLGHVFASESWLMRPLRSIMRLLLRSDRVQIIVQNPEDQAELEALALKPVHLLLGAGVDTDVFFPVKKKDMNTEIVITHASRLLWSKGVGELVAATRMLRDLGFAINVQVVGMPDEQNPDAIPLETLQAWHDEGVIHWLGYQRDMAAIYQQSDIAVLASYYREGIPKTLIEAASVGLPIVTTDTPGCRIIVVHNENGVLISPRDASALADALRSLIVDADMRYRYGQTGRDRVMKEFAAPIIYQKTIALYQKIVSPNPRSH